MFEGDIRPHRTSERAPDGSQRNQVGKCHPVRAIRATGPASNATRHAITTIKSMILLFMLVFLGTIPGTAGAEQKIHRPALIPKPLNVELRRGEFRLNSRTRIVTNTAELRPLADVLASEIDTITGLRCDTKAVGRSRGDIALRIDAGLAEETYRLEIGEAVQIRGGSYAAVAYGTATLLQSLQNSHGGWTLPVVSISDKPRFAFRGALIDLARKYHSPAGIRQVIELCRLYKIRFLHLHLSDDQLFMFPSLRFPQIGRSNREFARFEPASSPHIAPYTRAELEALEEYARVRGVALVPELDLPGHSGRLIADAPDRFGIAGNGSTVNIANPATVSALIDLLNEVMDVFRSSPYVHLGADEVGLDGLEQTSAYREAQAQFGIKSVHELYCKFVATMAAAVTKRGKRPVVWEEAWNTDGPYPLPKSAIVMVWSQGRSPQAIVNSGYDVVNATWTPLYIVRDNRKTPEFLYRWHPGQFGREGSTEFNTLVGKDGDRLLGAQICSWENSEAIEIPSLRERIAVVAERTWSAEMGGDYTEFRARLQRTDALLDLLVHPIALNVRGGGARGENSFTEPITLELVPRQHGLEIRYTLDNSLPGPHWKRYSGPVTLTRTAHLRAGLFDSNGTLHGFLLGAWFTSEIPQRPNLATHRPVTVGPSPDRTDGWFARLAVDGKADDAGAHWASEGPAPQWLQVDLQKVQTIDTITLITYWDNSRYYQWNAEASLDNRHWTRVLDYSNNTTPATSAGYSGAFTPVQARYVRINMLKNSANPYVHIVELIVDRSRRAGH